VQKQGQEQEVRSEQARGRSKRQEKRKLSRQEAARTSNKRQFGVATPAFFEGRTATIWSWSLVSSESTVRQEPPQAKRHLPAFTGMLCRCGATSLLFAFGARFLPAQRQR